MKTSPRSEAFALISTLALLVIIAILITAFVSTMRTERIASHNYSEYKQAQALAQTTLNRLIAENTAPILSNGQPLKPYTLRNDGSKQPDNETTANYITADPPEPGIFRMEPQSGISTANHLLRLSRAAGGASAPAYQPRDWKYLRLEDPIFEPKSSAGVPTAPDWIDYKLPDGSVIGQIAFAIWEEGGKFDVNLAGADGALNGMAPHDLGFERTSADPERLVRRLNGEDGDRQRSNFSLRRISRNASIDNTGDDQRVFTIEELLRDNLVSPAAAADLTSFSRDFDVRPEWDGNRAASTAQQFLRSYVNNPDLYRLMSGSETGSIGPSLVKATMNEQTLRNALTARGLPANASWMQIMRLLAALRLTLPPYSNLGVPAKESSLDPGRWTDNDIWGIALNIVQASDARSDQNLAAWDKVTYPNNYEDPFSRFGVRIGPYVSEVAIRLTRTGPSSYIATEYIEMWNPYPVDLTSHFYDVGETTGKKWPTAGGALWTNTGSDGTAWKRQNIPGPPAGGFRTVELGSWTFSTSDISKQVGAGNGFRVRFSPFIVDARYRAGDRGTDYQISKAPLYSNSNATDAAQFPFQLTAWIPPGEMPAEGASVWYSYQIDDPRMGPLTRYSANRIGANATAWTSANDPGWSYSWQGYINQHSLAGISEGPKVISSFGDGYNVNFGQNWPASWPKSSEGLKRALATFALPERPFRNLGELGTVFAFRPWRTLSFAATVAPEEPSISPPSSPSSQNYPTALLDYLTTLGTTSDNRNLNYKVPPGSNSGGFVDANLKLREQDMRWLFESVDASGNPAGALRPIRGRINLNTADFKTLSALLKAPYRLVDSLGLRNWTGFQEVNTADYAPDLKIRIQDQDAEAIAAAIVDPSNGIRPLRSLSDLARLDTKGVLAPLYAKYPESVVDAIMGRLAQFGTIRQQIYTFDIIARTLNPIAKKKGQDVITAEVRLLARVYFDTFSRKAFIESIEYR